MIVLALAGGASVVACSAILGLQEPTVDAGYGDGSGGGDGPAGDGGNGGDGSLCNGKDCLGGACVNNQCQPLSIASGYTDLGTIQSTPGGVFFTDFTGGKVVRVNPNGTTQVVGDSNNGLGDVWGVASDGTDVYITDGYNYTIDKCPISGCTGSTNFWIGADAGLNRPAYISIDGNDLYFLDVFAAGVYHTTKAGTPVTQLAVSDTGYYQGVLAGFAYDGTRAYWTEPFNGTSILKSVPKGGGTPTTLFSAGPPVPRAPVVINGDVYFVSRAGAGSIQKIKGDGSQGSPQSVAGGQNNPSDLTTDGQYLYWVNEGTLDASGVPTAATTDGQVVRCPISSCQPEVLVSNLKGPWGIAVDSVAIYFITIVDGQVWKLAK